MRFGVGGSPVQDGVAKQPTVDRCGDTHRTERQAGTLQQHVRRHQRAPFSNRGGAAFAVGSADAMG